MSEPSSASDRRAHQVVLRSLKPAITRKTLHTTLKGKNRATYTMSLQGVLLIPPSSLPKYGMGSSQYYRSLVRASVSRVTRHEARGGIGAGFLYTILQ
ncbi:hypothetical protein TrLO_g13678 [Triparma laevis f. longispina]|uniref:Uncharacterized protein n=1 Tax=Triparma laevis f. longispina TaxID=1714387 RepID=A0A9W6ZL47_9STRA|nr:hypothetical protein TrLO_g13678 [Triparma laevis f. longispina]